MPKYLFIYHADKPMQPEPGQEAEAMAAWGRWMETHAAAIDQPGDPVGLSKSVTADGISDSVPNAAFGYSIVSAPDMDAACKIAADNPMVAGGGSVEVAEIMPIEM
ncbi:YciI family protein [Pseudooceanicola aestuarii]|uniref:YciI family protein n=1 Tax=Pseudooceanicola aestuarii TaxID=2697319 RepID=UPI0013D0BA73|nr:YciI family protein [Pseudooceanicola aestuarii]